MLPVLFPLALGTVNYALTTVNYAPGLTASPGRSCRWWLLFRPPQAMFNDKCYHETNQVSSFYWQHPHSFTVTLHEAIRTSTSPGLSRPGAGAAIVDLVDTLRRGVSPVDISGLSPAAGAYFLTRLLRTQPRPLLVVTPDGLQETLLRDLAFFLGLAGETPPGDIDFPAKLLSFPAHENLPFQELTRDTRVASARLEAAYSLLAPDGAVPLVVASLAGLTQLLPPPETVGAAVEYVAAGETLDRDKFLAKLIAGGYERRPLAEEVGDFSVRGGIIDVFPPLFEHPLRLEFWGDEVESLRFFNPVSQRSLKHLAEAVILPVTEVILDEATRTYALSRLRSLPDLSLREQVAQGRHFPHMERLLPYFYPECATLWDFLPRNALVVEWDPLNLQQGLQTQAAASPADSPGLELALDAWRHQLPRFSRLRCHQLAFGDALTLPSTHRFQLTYNQDLRASLSSAAESQERLLRPLARHLADWLASGFHVIFVSRSRTQAERLQLLLADYGVAGEVAAVPSQPRPGSLICTWDGLSAGFQWLAEGLVVVTEAEVFGAPRLRSRPKSSKPLDFFAALTDLQVGDPVVHINHGIGLFRGLVTMTVGSEVNDFLQLEYLSGDKLYLPVDRLDQVQKYLGVEDALPALDRLGGKAWERTKKRVRQAVEKIARELVALYAARQILPGHRYSPPDPAFREFEAAFQYEETPDQLQAIQDVLDDLGGDKPMDRLICGDVGYGKTEVALRAAFKVAMDGKQVAFLVPTTVLAEQHHETCRQRFRPYPLEVRVLSRFKSRAEQKRTLEELAAGRVDVVIGTHRLLSKDVHFKDLGLVIVDEEQRFGVSHKEKLKHLRQEVDVLTLTATPIPRTLQLSMTGIRDLSIINTPPEARQAVRTYLVRPEDAVIREAIRRELGRQGQVFFVHNRVQNLERYVGYLSRLVPEARVAGAHGQMPEKDLEEVMRRFWRGEVDVLVCTAIIEAGLDIPRANTIIINRAHRLGLSQVYQLRGRVGRSREQAYAYLLVPEDESLNPEAQKRLKALMEFTELGSGFKIALHDLQIRGAGNLLGAAQSGHIAEVGYELYLQLLEEAVQELKGQPLDHTPEPELHLPVAAYLPDTYVPDIDQRLVLYRRLSGRLETSEVEALAAELRDCYGPLPEEAQNLLWVVQAKSRLRELGIKRLDLTNGAAVVALAESAPVDRERLLAFISQHPKRLRLTPDQHLRLTVGADGSPWDRLKKVLKDIEIFVKGDTMTRKPPPPAP